MSKKVIATEKAPGAIGPYSQAMRIGNMIFTSGQIPLNPATGEMVTEIAAATKQSLENVKAILEVEGATMDNVIKTDRITLLFKIKEFFAPLGDLDFLVA